MNPFSPVFCWFFGLVFGGLAWLVQYHAGIDDALKKKYPKGSKAAWLSFAVFVLSNLVLALTGGNDWLFSSPRLPFE